jgi:hypothetical protein
MKNKKYIKKVLIKIIIIIIKIKKVQERISDAWPAHIANYLKA